MTWLDRLRDANRELNDALSEQDAQSVRRVVVVAAQEPRSMAVSWLPRPVAIAAMVALLVVSGILARRQLPRSDSAAVPQPQSPAGTQADDRRQLQFSTPGGTRIIWTFNPDFDLKGNAP